MITTLLSLPTEIILGIANRLDYESELNALSQVNRQFYEILTPLLYWLDPICCEESKSANPLRGCATYALEWAVANGLEATAGKALAAGVKPSAYLVGCAARDGYENLVELLYRYNENNVDLDVDVQRPTIHAQGPDCVMWNIRRLCGTPLTQAAQYGHETTVQLLLTHGADINGRSISMTPPLSVPLVAAAASGHLLIVELLVDSGADISFYDSGLGFAVGRGHVDVVRFLIERGADANYQDPQYEDNSPLLIAAKNGHVDVIRCLLEHNSSQDNLSYGIRALHAVAQSQFKEALELIAQHFDFPRASKTVADQTAVACAAASCGSAKLLENIISQGWDVRSPPIPGFS